MSVAKRTLLLFVLTLTCISAAIWMRSSQRSDQVHIRTPLASLILHSDRGRLLLFGTFESTDEFAPFFVSCQRGEVTDGMVHSIDPKSEMARRNVSTTTRLFWNRPMQSSPTGFVRLSSMMGLFQGWGVYLPHWLAILSLVAFGWFIRMVPRFTLSHGLLFVTYVCVLAALVCGAQTR